MSQHANYATALNPDTFHWARYWLPYNFQKIDHAKFSHVYLPLNREYKPIGILTYSPRVKYEDYPLHYVRFHSDPHKFVDVWVNDEFGGLFLYDDGQQSRDTYFNRLARLCSHKMTMINYPKRGEL